MKRTVFGVALALALPGVAQAQYQIPPDANKNASKACKAERAAVGDATFRMTYGTNKTRSNAHGKCVSQRRKAEQTNLQNAAQACTAERNQDATAFANKYGTGKKKANAYGRCVSGKAAAASAAQTKVRVNAARTCRTERAKDKAAFTAKYGTGTTKRNAFGRCVSQTAKAKTP